MASKKLAVRLKTKYVTTGGHIVTPVKRCGCGSYLCQVRKGGRYLVPKTASYQPWNEDIGGKNIDKLVHYHPNGKVSTECADDNARKPSAFDVVAIWED